MKEKESKILALYLMSTGVFFIVIGLIIIPFIPLLWWLLVFAGVAFCVSSSIYLIRRPKRKEQA